MNKKGKIIIVALIVSIIAIIFNYFISLNTIYFGSNTKAFIFGKKIIKLNINPKVVLKKVNYYNKQKAFKGYLKSDKDDNGYSYYIVTEHNKIVDTNDLIATGSMVKVNIVSSQDISVSINNLKLEEINKLFEINLVMENVIEYKNIMTDIDNDQTSEEVVYIKYLYNDVKTTKIFVLDDNEIYNIQELEVDYSDLANSSSQVYYLSNVIDINNDNIYEIIVGRIDGDSKPTYYDIYDYNNGIVKEIK